jgi:hypothetical protein
MPPNRRIISCRGPDIGSASDISSAVRLASYKGIHDAVMGGVRGGAPQYGVIWPLNRNNPQRTGVDKSRSVSLAIVRDAAS